VKDEYNCIEGDSFGSSEGLVLMKKSVSLNVIINMWKRATKHKLTIRIYRELIIANPNFVLFVCGCYLLERVWMTLKFLS